VAVTVKDPGRPTLKVAWTAEVIASAVPATASEALHGVSQHPIGGVTVSG
jgi:hypothetical protein